MAAEQEKSLRVVGGFELIEKIGQGGMGTVFKARQVSLDRIVAVKILPPSIAKDEKFIDRFQREARASAKLNHPHIIQGIDVGKDAATGLWYFAMEYVDGPSLKTILNEKTTLTEAKALEYAKQMAHALTCAQTNGIVHRDVKPDNILINSRDEAKLADLGLARHVSEETAAVPGAKLQAVGTPHYMAPEQCRGALNEIDIRTDIYALGATLFHLVTGKPPYDGPNGSSIMVKHLSEPPPLAHKVNPDVSEACGRLIERMMQKEREKRVQTPAELVAQIEKTAKAAAMAVKYGRPAKLADTAPRAPVTVRSGAARSRRQHSSAAATAVIAVVAIVVLLLWLPKGRSTSNTTAEGPSDVKRPPVAPNPVTPAPRTPATAQKTPPGPVVPPPKRPAPVVPKVVTPAVEPPVLPPPKKAEIAVAPDATQPAALPQPDVKTPAVATPEPEPKAAGPDPKLQIAHARFLGEIIRRSGKERKELHKVLPEVKELVLKPEFIGATDQTAGEMKDLERVIGFEEKAVEALAAAKGDLELPEDMAKLAQGSKTGKIVRSDRGRGLYVSVGGVEVSVPASKLPPGKLVKAVEGKDAYAAACYYLVRGATEQAREFLPGLPDADRERFQQKLDVLKVGEAEAAADEAYTEIRVAIRAKQWPALREKIILFEAVHGQTATGAKALPALAAYKEFAELETLAPLSKLFHAASVQVLPGGYVQAVYDFASIEQLKDFVCDGGSLDVRNIWMRVASPADAAVNARYLPAMAELRSLEVTGSAGRPSPTPDEDYVGLCIVPPGAKDPLTAPRCIITRATRKPTLEGWEPPYQTGKVNAVGAVPVPGNEVLFQAVNEGGAWKWSVGGQDVGKVKLPAIAAGGRLMFAYTGPRHFWRNMKITFKPDPQWVRQQSDTVKARAKAD
jgi:serine/threonine-protein kinase